MQKKNIALEVTFQPSMLSAMVPLGSLITEAMMEAGVFIPLDCGGNGTCGSCLVSVQGEVSEPSDAEKRMLEPSQLEEGWRLACQTEVLGDLSVFVPETRGTSESSWQIDAGDIVPGERGTPVIVSESCEIPAPSLDDPRADLRRVLKVISEQEGIERLYADTFTASQVTDLARRHDWHLNAFRRGRELVGVAAPGRGPLGLAVDLGSTKLAGYLLDLETGEIIASKGRLNPQVSFGADVVTRLQKAVGGTVESGRLTDMVRDAINGLAQELAESVNADCGRICEMSVVGNSVMIHLLLHLPLEQLGAPPFVACMDQATDIKARDIGLDSAPGAYLHLPPLIGGFVGSDNVAMVMGGDLDRPGTCRLGLDIGTNTEVVLVLPGEEPSLLIASAPSGPTFEGAHLSSGMRAMGGAISKVWFQDGKSAFETIDGAKPAGLCGSGIIDAIAAMLGEGIINGQGHLDQSNERVKADERSISYVLVPSEHSATGRDITVTQSDISQLQMAKGAISAAAATLLSIAGLESKDLSEVVMAGSFGSHFDVVSARRIGLIPDVSGADYKQIGNAAGRGAQFVLNNREARNRAVSIPAMTRYVELTSQPKFNSLFARSLQFPAQCPSRNG
ncbi:MAG: ASKHA domain-containing protein [Desulfobacteraceae bacterium]|nr:ASKHA domain-containing protein [Desulfobacteraceae bacterium]